MGMMDLLLNNLWVLVSLLLLVVAFFSGRHYRSRHLASIIEREAALAHIRVIAVKRVPPVFGDQQLVCGSVVVSSDYFTRLLAFLRNLVGGNLRTHEVLLDLARREAVLRLKQQAAAAGADAVLNLKISTVPLDDVFNRQSGTVGTVEVLAYGTAGRIRRQD